jgi:unsaturated chondroitin disaccharide hydrolase
LSGLFDEALEFASTQLESTVTAIGTNKLYPRTTDKENNWETTSSKSWTSGFFPGCLWYMYQYTGDNKWRTWAEKWTEGLVNEQYNINTHDIGFMMNCSYGNGYRLTQNKIYRNILLQSAESLIQRYNKTVQSIKSWEWMTPVEDYPFPVIIDNMMNLELLFWASKNSGEQKYSEVAVTHANTTMLNHIREDFSTWHIVQYDPLTGIVKGKHTVQGYGDDSAWSRGQAWAIYGFTVAYRETGTQRYLETACRLADYYISRLPSDFVPYWDFDDPAVPYALRDSSAGAIASSGLLELNQYCGSDYKEKYWDAGVKALKSLTEPAYLAKDSGNPAILLHGVGAKPRDVEIDVPLIYGDYYLIEAILRYKEYNR